MSNTRTALVCLYVTTISMGINGVFSKIIPLGAVTTTCLRSIIAALALAVFVIWLKRERLLLADPRHYKVVVFLGLLLAMHWSCFFHAMQASTVAIGILAHYSYPVITVIAEPLFVRRLPALGDIAAGCGVLAGVTLMVLPQLLASPGAPGGELLTGVTFGLLSALTFGTRNIVQHRWLKDSASANVMFFQLLTVAVVTLPFIDWTGVADLNPKDWHMLLLLGVVSTATLHTLIAFSLRTLSAKTVSLVSCLQPPSAITLSWLIVGEQPTLSTLVGGAVILTISTFESVKASRRAASTHARRP